MADLEDILDQLEELTPAEREQLASHYGLSVPAPARVEPDEHDVGPLSDAAVNAELRSWKAMRGRDLAGNLRSDDWQALGEYVAEGYSVEDAYEQHFAQVNEQHDVSDLDRLQREAEARERRPLLDSEKAALTQAYHDADARGVEELDWRPLDLNDSEQRGAYLDQRLGADPDFVREDLDASRNEYSEIEADLETPEGRALALDAMLGGEDVIDLSTPEPPDA